MLEVSINSVSLSFLEEVLYAFNFPISFVQWIHILYAEKELRLVYNSHSTDAIFPLRGCAQGCSLSLLLYVLVMEALALSICANSNIPGFKVNNYHKKIAMLADNTLLVLKANKMSFESTFLTLKEFAIISNLKVNETKSVIIPLNVKPETCTSLQELSHFSWLQGSSFKYVGITIPLDLHPPAASHSSLLMPDIMRILKERRKADTSMLGRVVVLQSLVGSKLLYPLSLAPSPSVMEIKQLQKPCTDFVWNFEMHHLKFDILCQDYAHSGINMYSIQRQDYALKLSWMVRLLTPVQQY